MEHNVQLGRRGENEALDFLLSRGYKLVARNWRHSHIELDLIVEDETCLRVVEVKTRTETLISPIESVRADKIKRIIRATNSFVRRYNIEKDVVFDIISIIHSPTGVEIEYTPNAFNVLAR